MAYDYVKRAYGVDPKVGQRVRMNEGCEPRKEGVIAPESPSHGHYVQVRFDGQNFASNCHPTSIDYLT